MGCRAVQNRRLLGDRPLAPAPRVRRQPLAIGVEPLTGIALALTTVSRTDRHGE
jgi:hypothetical protein